MAPVRFRPRALFALVTCACTFVLIDAPDAAAQLVPGWNTKQFTLERLDADRIRLMREVEIEGEKGSPNEGQKFFADDMELNTRTGELTASGNVVFSTVDSRISADSVVFNNVQIAFRDGSGGTIEDSTLSGSIPISLSGSSIVGPAQPTIRDCTITGTSYGLQIAGTSRPTVTSRCAAARPRPCWPPCSRC